MDMLTVKKSDKQFFADIAVLLQTARSNSYYSVNSIMIETYWKIGKKIVEQEQKGKERANYGDYLMTNLSRYLTDTFGKGFSEPNLRAYSHKLRACAARIFEEILFFFATKIHRRICEAKKAKFTKKLPQPLWGLAKTNPTALLQLLSIDLAIALSPRLAFGLVLTKRMRVICVNTP
ncbi:MAG: DUF1016 N-terminal domain-containing protein [Endomicrobium sp.]|jgi:hypothetical protein|nr:DUF1016 N-terminal domain-containing protein [Endomicrobium sp.]